MPDSKHHLSDEDRLAAELVLLVDGRLVREREAALEARAADPELARPARPESASPPGAVRERTVCTQVLRSPPSR